MLPLYLSKITNPDQSLLTFDEDGKPVRGLRTFGEIAHYVRCIPYLNEDIGDIWCSPDFIMSRKVGTDIDHALLMASIFRTSKYEDLSEYLKFVKDIRKKTRSRKEADKELLTVNIPGEETKKEDDETCVGPETNGETKTHDEAGGHLHSHEPAEDSPVDTVDDRVFVCLGKATDVPDKK